MLAIYKHQIWILLGIWTIAGAVCLFVGLFAALSGEAPLAILAFGLLTTVQLSLITSAWLRPYLQPEKEKNDGKNGLP